MIHFFSTPAASVLRQSLSLAASFALVAGLAAPSFAHDAGPHKKHSHKETKPASDAKAKQASKPSHGKGHSHGKKKKKHSRKVSKVNEVISFDVYRQPNGTIDLLKVKNIPGQGTVIFHSRSTNDGKSFGPSLSVGSRLKVGQDFVKSRPPKRGGDWQIASSGDNIIISYEKFGGGKRGSGPLRTLLSRDGGVSFEHYKNISDTTQGQTFVDIAATKDGTFHWVWLENHPDGRGLRHAIMDLDAKDLTAVENHVDKKTCFCCWNAVKAYGNGLYAIYRDKKPSDMRMAYSLDKGKTWQKGGRVGAFDWEFPGCPHVGSSMAFDTKAQPPGGKGRSSRPFLHATAWTAMEGKLGLYYQNWSGSGTKWSAPYKLAELGRRGDIAVVDNMVVAVYEELVGETMVARVRVADVTKSPIRFSAPRTITSKPTFYPRLEATKHGVIMFSNQDFGGRSELVVDRLTKSYLKRLLKAKPARVTATAAVTP